MSMQERRIPASLDRIPLGFAETKEKLASVAVAVLIVGLGSSKNGDNESDPLIWTISELKSKFETDKVAGEISIPAETRKNGESAEDNVFGALTEFCDDTAFPWYIKKHVIRMDGNWYRGKGVIVRERLVDVAVLIYDGAIDFPLKPTCSDEVSPNGWVKKSELAMYPNLREMSKQVLDLDSSENLIREALESYHKNPERRRQIFPDNFDSMRKFSNERDYGTDEEVVTQAYREVWKKIPEAHRLTLGAINLLVEAQSQEKRDYKREEAIVSDLGKKLKEMDEGDYAIGIRELSGLGIRTVGIPKGGLRSWGERREELVREGHNPTSSFYEPPEKYELTPSTKTSVENKKCWGFFELQRGDELGYPEELGKDWYLVFSPIRPKGDPNYYDMGIIPISGIRNLKLRPYDAYGL